MIDTLVKVLRALGARARVQDKDVSPAAAAVAEMGVVLSRADAAELRRLLSSIAGVREQLEAEKGAFEQKPVEALTDADSHTFLSGAMWAASEFVQARIDDLQAAHDAGGRTSERSALRSLAVELLRSGGTLTPSALAAAARERGLNGAPDRVSKALGDLLREGLLATANPPAGDADRRYRHFVLAHGQRPAQPVAAAPRRLQASPLATTPADRRPQ